MKERLFALADKKYAVFHGHLLPPGTPVIGVRMPLLKQLAKEITSDKTAAVAFLQTAANDYYEERVLQGLVIAGLKLTAREQLMLIRRFLPQIDNWAVCDSFCAALKSFRKIQPAGWDFLQKCMISKKPYTQRFGIVMALDHYTDREYAEMALADFEQIITDEYYVEMAIAWAVSVYFVKEPFFIYEWLKNCRLSEKIFNKAIQKCCESRRVSTEDKLRLRKLKSERKND